MAQLEHLVIAGLHIDVFTRTPLRASNRPIVVLFLLHGRHGSALAIRNHIEVILERSQGAQDVYELLVVAFDHRNHGSRIRDPKSNNSWNRDPEINNERHALDMYAIQTGTASDVSHLIDFLPAYLFPKGNRSIHAWGVAGISLGGHSTWLALGQDSRLSFGVPIIGCPDYMTLIRGRALKLHLPPEPPYFPTHLAEIVNRNDPAAKPFDRLDATNPFLGKKILVLSGADDKLVPWDASRKFVESLEVGDKGIKKAIVQTGIGHECTKEMLEELANFVGEEYLRK